MTLVVLLGGFKIFFFCLYLFWGAAHSALSADVLQRWQVMVFPSENLWTKAGILLSMVMLLAFWRSMMTQNRHLMIFVAWYAAVLGYLGQFKDAIPSRYFIYISVFFSVSVCLFFVEVLGGLVSERWGSRYRKILYFLFSLFFLGNAISIKMRLLATQLTDYHWSYDYIKIANLIRQDILQKNTGQGVSLCIEGLKDIPYAGQWREGFLQRFDFSRYDPFRQTLAAVGWDFRRNPVVINALCPDSSVVYRVREATVLDSTGKSIEPFYGSFTQGLEELKIGDEAGALARFEEAMERRPFLINFVMGPSTDSIMAIKPQDIFFA